MVKKIGQFSLEKRLRVGLVQPGDFIAAFWYLEEALHGGWRGAFCKGMQ